MKLLKYAVLATLLFSCSLLSFNNAGAATLTVSPANIAQGKNVTAQWSGVAAPSNRDWIGLYAAGAVDMRFIDWIYDNSCNRAGNDSALGAGACPFLIPNTLPNGTYELRLYANNNYVRLATSNQFTVSPVAPARFVNNGDGTISDTQTGLMWEQKTGTVGAANNPSDPHNVNNRYNWSSSSGPGAGNIPFPDGRLFTEFLTWINRADGRTLPSSLEIYPKFYSDWRIPTLAELATIMDETQPSHIAPAFEPNQVFYWTSTSYFDVHLGWVVNFETGTMGIFDKGDSTFARAVRGGR